MFFLSTFLGTNMRCVYNALCTQLPQTHAYARSLARTNARAHTCGLFCGCNFDARSLYPPLSLALSRPLSPSLSLALSRPLSPSLSLALSRPLSLSLSLALSHPLSLSLSLASARSLSFARSLARIFLSY